MKVKVDRNKLVEASRIKKVQFDKLIEDFSPALECMGSREVKKSATKRSHKLIELVDKYDEGLCLYLSVISLPILVIIMKMININFVCLYV